MPFEIILGSERIVSTWSGGTSSQICIYPKSAEYPKHDFLFRVSTAVANTQDFCSYTPLPGITRHLLMLEGDAVVYHTGHYSKAMTPYQEIDTFDGGWESYSVGKVRDFNLMCAESCCGELSVLSSSCRIRCDGWSHLLLYCSEGTAEIFSKQEHCLLYAEDSVLISPPEAVTIDLYGKIVCARIYI